MTRILSMTAENVKRITFVDFDPDRNVVVLAGPNGAGKSSILDAIWLALGGKRAASAIPDPIREGQDEAFVELDLGDLIVTRSWKRGEKPRLEVTNAEGVQQRSPAALLDEIVGRFTFDPLAFMAQPPQDQVQTLLGVIDFPARADGSVFDLDQIERERIEAYEERRVTRLARDQMQHRIDGMVEPPEGTPDEVVSAKALLAEVDVISNMHAAIASADGRVEEAGRSLEEATERVARARAELADAEREQAGAWETYGAVQEARKALPEPPPLAPLREQIENVDQVNADVRARQARAAAVAELEQLQAVFDRAQSDLDDIAREKREALESADMPVDGLTFDEEPDGRQFLRYNGVKLSDVSSSEAIRIGVTIGMALNPDLQVMQVRDGSLLDSKAMDTLAQLARDHDHQVWIERVDESGQIGLIIEEGTIAS